jgi:RNA polymerase sigma-70 factor (ECF subfamily)
VDFEEVYNKYSKDVFRFCLSLCKDHANADDLVSEAFLKAIKSSDSFRGQCSVKAWLCQIAKNTYYDHLRKYGRITGLPEEIMSESDFEIDLSNKAEALRIHKLLHLLGDPYNEVFSLRVFAELSFSEIGDVLGKTESWARVTFHRARLKIKEADNND